MFDLMFEINELVRNFFAGIKMRMDAFIAEIKDGKRCYPKWNSMKKPPKENKAVSFFVEDKYGEKKVISKYAMFDGRWWFYSEGRNGELILERESSDVVEMLEYLYKNIKWAYTNDWNMSWYEYNLVVKRNRKRERLRKKELKKKMELQAKLEKSGDLIVEERRRGT